MHNASNVPLPTHEYWIRQAMQTLHENISPCPFEYFGAVVVNHTASSSLGDLVCTGINTVSSTGNPILHGETAALNNCTAILTDPEGHFKLSPAEALLAYRDLTLYTTSEPCPMCASAIRFAGFKECVYATNITARMAHGWPHPNLLCHEVFERVGTLPTRTSLIRNVLTNETDPYLLWQFDQSYPCPDQCERNGSNGHCVPMGSLEYVQELKSEL
ncbi:hypothetical protein BAUCODRAFT_61005 [Baudoinia panamericana UAMH 10762]|uniref:CMP/dCMP-type deaminase domain-containing protein n=1 Tax=Baudoinia panamericana (strain UAMH 10762) TaxID=717646 RepID=M2NMS8_BAUPA|nr:uncharacterized protein BAUCODRAFT_61005 [Baudoinia panamericana UAMH 10762]EMD00491.1 hypothetical protein BAUCODRAFT_61005 [Baudoinia panamericana UAMH 10762]